MLNLTLTITAAPELLAAIKGFTSAITAAKVVTIPEYNSDFTAQSYTMEQLAVAATQLVDTGHRAELVSLLSSFDVQALTALPKEQCGAFATQLRALGVRI